MRVETMVSKRVGSWGFQRVLRKVARKALWKVLMKVAPLDFLMVVPMVVEKADWLVVSLV